MLENVVIATVLSVVATVLHESVNEQKDEWLFPFRYLCMFKNYTL